MRHFASHWQKLCGRTVTQTGAAPGSHHQCSQHQNRSIKAPPIVSASRPDNATDRDLFKPAARGKAAAVAHQPAGSDGLAEIIDRGYGAARYRRYAAGRELRPFSLGHDLLRIRVSIPVRGTATIPHAFLNQVSIEMIA